VAMFAALSSCDRYATPRGAIGAVRLYLWRPFCPFRYIQVVVLK
jgi:hypothetical protein